MNIAIIGVGNVGGGLARAATAAGHTITVAAEDPDHAAEAAKDIGVNAALSNVEAAEAADVIVLAVPYPALEGVMTELGGAANGKTVIDATNPLNESYSGLATETSAAEEAQTIAPAAKVVKAFNTILAARHADPTEGDQPLDAFYAGDDPAAKKTVADLASSLGYRPIDVGGVTMARALEQMAFVNISLNANNGWAWQSAWKLVGPVG